MADAGPGSGGTGTPVAGGGGDTPGAAPGGAALARQSSAQEWIYFERQTAALCAVHALNGLVQVRFVGAFRPAAARNAGGRAPPQAPTFTEVQLAEIARELDEKEKALLMADGPSNPALLQFLAVRRGAGAVSTSWDAPPLPTCLHRMGAQT